MMFDNEYCKLAVYISDRKRKLRIEIKYIK